MSATEGLTVNTMNQCLIDIEDLADRIDDPETSIAEARASVAALIRRTVSELRARPTYWVKSHIVDACRAYNDNTNVNRIRPTKWWLLTSLVALFNAFSSCHDEDYCPREAAVDQMSFDDLSACVSDVLA